MPILYSYYRSSCSYRVRIALNLKNIDCEYRYININPQASEQKKPAFLDLNPQGRVPYFVDGDIKLSQSTAILEYLEEAYPETPLLPENQLAKAHVRQLVNLIACDIQPLNNISVLGYLKHTLSVNQKQIDDWYRHWIQQGFATLEAFLHTIKNTGSFCYGDVPTLADAYLVPQYWNAQRFDVPLEDFPTLARINAHCRSLDTFIKAAPEQQADKPKTA